MRAEHECGFVSYCGRNLGHSGQHGGWRTGVSVRATSWGSGAELTGRELRVIGELSVHGLAKGAAACMGITEQTVKNLASTAISKTGAEGSRQIPYLLGWLQLPTGVTIHTSNLEVEALARRLAGR